MPNPNEIQDGSAPSVELRGAKVVTIRPNGRTLCFPVITPREIGFLELKISARSSGGWAVLYEKLQVEAEGEVMYRNDIHLVDLTSKGELELNITADTPHYAMPGSSRSGCNSGTGVQVSNLQLQ